MQTVALYLCYRNVLRPTPGDPWGVEQHHWNTGAEENQQLNPGASPLNAPVASGATTFGAILVAVGRTVLAKKDASTPRNPPPPNFTLS